MCKAAIDNRPCIRSGFDLASKGMCVCHKYSCFLPENNVRRHNREVVHQCQIHQVKRRLHGRRMALWYERGDQVRWWWIHRYLRSRAKGASLIGIATDNICSQTIRAWKMLLIGLYVASWKLLLSYNTWFMNRLTFTFRNLHWLHPRRDFVWFLRDGMMAWERLTGQCTVPDRWPPRELLDRKRLISVGQARLHPVMLCNKMNFQIYSTSRWCI